MNEISETNLLHKPIFSKQINKCITRQTFQIWNSEFKIYKYKKEKIFVKFEKLSFIISTTQRTKV